MPPKKLTISRIRSESRVRSHDPDLNRSSSSSSFSRRSNNASGSGRPSQRYRAVASFSSSSPSTSRNVAASGSRRVKRPPQPKTSARISYILQDDIEETRVQNLFAPDTRTQRQNVSYRPLTLSQKARRDGSAFQLPSLGSMCCSVIASCFDALLPSQHQFEAAAATSTTDRRKVIRNSHTLNKAANTRKRSRARAFGAAPNSDDDDQKDYVPSDDDASTSRNASRSTRSRRNGSTSNASSADGAGGSSQLLAGWTTSELHYLTRKTSEQLKLLSPAASFLLFRTLSEHAPQFLTKTVVGSYFLPTISPEPTSSHAQTATTAARTHVWLPASLPLLAHDKSAASNLVGHLHKALVSSLTPQSSILSQSAAEDMPLAALPSRLVSSPPAYFALRSLQLHGLTRLQDGSIARFFEAAVPPDTASKQPAPQDYILRLDTISLRGCIAVSDRTVTAICRSTGPSLQYLNLDFTDVTADSITMIMMSAPNLKTLKVGYNDNISDKTLQVALQAPYCGSLPFSKLVNLRLRQCSQVGDVGVASFLKYTYKTLEVLDISGTGVGGTNPHSPDFNILLMSLFPSGLPDLSSEAEEGARRSSRSSDMLALKKLNLLDTNLDFDSLIKIVDRAPQLNALLLRQMPSRTTHDRMINLLEKLVAPSPGWQSRPWERLHLRILDVGDEFADLFPQLLAIFPVRIAQVSLEAS